MYDHSAANAKRKGQLKDFEQTNALRELFGIDVEPIEFEWTIFQGFTSIEILRLIQKYLNARRINPEQVERIILLMSMCNDIDWTKNRSSEVKWDQQTNQIIGQFQRSGHPIF